MIPSLIKNLDLDAEHTTLLEIDRQYSVYSNSEGLVKAFLKYSSEQIRLFRNDIFPVSGKEASVTSFSEKSGSWTWDPIVRDIASSADLGYTYGICQLKANGSKLEVDEYYRYLRIWKKELTGDWKILCLTSPI